MQELFTAGVEQGGPKLTEQQPTWSKLVTWQDQRCSPEFLQQCNSEISQNATDTEATSSSPLATGYGLATYAHTLATAPKSIEGYDACGTIQDFLAFVFCGHHSPADASIDTTNACSWGGFDVGNAEWNRETYVYLTNVAAQPSACCTELCTGMYTGSQH